MALGDVNITLHQMLSVMMRYTGHVTRVGKMRNVYKILVRALEGKRVGRPRCKWDVNKKWVLKKLNVRLWTGFTWLSIGSSGGLP